MEFSTVNQDAQNEKKKVLKDGMTLARIERAIPVQTYCDDPAELNTGAVHPLLGLPITPSADAAEEHPDSIMISAGEGRREGSLRGRLRHPRPRRGFQED